MSGSRKFVPGRKPPAAKGEAAGKKPPAGGSPPGAEAEGLPEFSDEALALEFTAKHADNLRYVAVWGRWFEWTGDRWRQEDTLRAFDLARGICRAASTRAGNAKVADDVASARTVAAVERLPRADRRHAARVDQWDTDLLLLNTPGGSVDLKTGELRPHRRDDYVTKVTAVTPGGECPLWLGFLDRVTGGDKQLRAFLQRMAGYSLTGLTSAHALFFLYGTGGNGKGVFLNTLTSVVGDYAAVAPIETFTDSRTERHPTDLAMLRGARLVTAQETEQGRRWAESRIKSMTGGDPISARFVRQDFFTFTPQFKLIVAGNHRPGLRNVDEAIRRRLHLVPFEIHIPPEERDEELPAKLRAEWPGILRWAIDGCLDWHDMGLAPPPAVRAATDAYLDAEDAVGCWLAECCLSGPEYYSLSADLFASWAKWAHARGEFVGKAKNLSQTLIDRGFVPRRSSDGRSGFQKLHIIPAKAWDEASV